jgi:hypothetical protein
MSDEQIDDGGPVFPHDNVPGIETGMTLRQHYAGLAMKAFVGLENHTTDATNFEDYVRLTAIDSLAMADAMIRTGKIKPTATTTKKE